MKNLLKTLIFIFLLTGGKAFTQSGTNDPTFNADQFDFAAGFSGLVFSIINQPDGKILVGGQFTSFNGVSRRNIARLNADGSLDTTFNPGDGVNAAVTSMALYPDGRVVAVGFFTNHSGISRNYVTRFNPDGSIDLSFNPGTGANNLMWSVGLQEDGKILIGGNFTIFNGVSINRIARL